MSIIEDFTAALHELSAGAPGGAATVPVLLARACARVLPVEGASLSLLSETVRMPMGASDLFAGQAERLQFTLGEGPCLEVYRTRQIQRFTAVEVNASWPLYAAELTKLTSYRSCASLPLDLGDGLCAALDIYCDSPDGPTEAIMSDAGELGDEIIAALSLTTVAVSEDTGPDWLRNESMTSRGNIWISIALLGVHSSLTSADIVAVMRAYAVGRDQTLDQVTQAVASLALDPRMVLG